MVALATTRADRRWVSIACSRSRPAAAAGTVPITTAPASRKSSRTPESTPAARRASSGPK